MYNLADCAALLCSFTFYSFDLILAVRCGHGGDRILLRHGTDWALPPAHRLLVSVESMPGPRAPAGAPGAPAAPGAVNLRVAVTNMMGAAVDLVMRTSDAPPPGGAVGAPRTHTWVHSETPLGEIAPNATRSVQCSVVPLVDGLIRLDTIRLVDRITGAAYRPSTVPVVSPDA